MTRYRSGEIRIDVHELLDQVDDDDLIECVNYRKLPTGNGNIAVSFVEVERAFDYLRKGDADEALLILERLVRPKWKTVADAEAALAKAVAA